LHDFANAVLLVLVLLGMLHMFVGWIWMKGSGLLGLPYAEETGAKVFLAGMGMLAIGMGLIYLTKN
jgi:hypothetical protein